MASKRYGDAWRKTRKATLRGQPLCALCLVSGKVVPAVVVDHKVPLEDGGTNAQENLQPLCKRCHDAIKTPVDIKYRKQAQETQLVLHVAWLGTDERTDEIDMRTLRRYAASIYGWTIAHNVMTAAIAGIVTRMTRDWKGNVVIATDDLCHAKQMNALHKVRVAVDPEGVAPRLTNADESRFLAGRYDIERQQRKQVSVGKQQPYHESKSP